MNIRSEIAQLVARQKVAVVGLADGTVLRGKFGAEPRPNDDLVAFATTEVNGPAAPHVQAGVWVALAAICWIEVL